MLPLLTLLEDERPRRVGECVGALQSQLHISDEDADALLSSGKQTVLHNRIHWARTYLAKAGLLRSVGRGTHEITAEGRALLASRPDKIDLKMLERYPTYLHWQEISRTGGSAPGQTFSSPVAGAAEERSAIEQTPEDAIETASQQLNAAVRDELLTLVRQMTPRRFERVILELLGAMGFGGGDLTNGRLTAQGADDGIDGIIHEDALGLDAVFVQAKRYAEDHRVGRPDMQKFIGSLTGEGATKGVFVTTSDFSRDAADYLRRVQHRVVLINGRRLAELMLAHA